MVGTQRRHLLVTAAVVSALAFGVGWMLGRGGRNASTGDATPPDATAAAPSVPEGLVGSTVPTVDPALLAPTTTFVLGWTLANADVDPRAAALGIHIVGARPGRVLELDTATGELAELEGTQDFRD